MFALHGKAVLLIISKCSHMKDMTTQRTQTIQKGAPSIRDIVVDARLRKVLAWNFLASGLGIALILGVGTFLGN